MTDTPQDSRKEQVAEGLIATAFDSIGATFDTTFVADYQHLKSDLVRLYGLAKNAQWNGSTDVDWTIEVDRDKPFMPHEDSALYGTEHWNRLSEEGRHRLNNEFMAWTLSQFLHGEQGALLATAQLVDSVPNIDAKLYASTQVMDEARHVEVFDRYLHDKLEIVYPINPELKLLLEQILSNSNWDMKYLGMQILVEGLALAAFHVMSNNVQEPLIADITRLTLQDEARHVAFGVLSLKGYYDDMTESEINERAEFIYEASRLMRDRFLGREVFEKMGMDVEACLEIEFHDERSRQFRQYLFSKIVPNVKKLGLLTPSLRKGFADLGVLDYEHLPSSEEELFAPGGGLAEGSPEEQSAFVN